MIKFIKKYIKFHPNRKNYRVKPCVSFDVDTNHYTMCLLPTIVFTPWFARYPDSPFISIMWFNMYINIGRFESVEKEADNDKTES